MPAALSRSCARLFVVDCSLLHIQYTCTLHAPTLCWLFENSCSVHIHLICTHTLLAVRDFFSTQAPDLHPHFVGCSLMHIQYTCTLHAPTLCWLFSTSCSVYMHLTCTHTLVVVHCYIFSTHAPNMQPHFVGCSRIFVQYTCS